MPPIVLTLLQILVLVLLYLFVARAVRAVTRDLRAEPAPAPAAGRRQAEPQPRAAPSPAGASGRAKPREARAAPKELVVHFPDGRPRVLPLANGDVTFGRDASSTVRLVDPYVSERHARVHRDGSEWMVSDLGSTNGTFLNRVRVNQPTPIAAGDQLAIGKTTVEVRR